MPAKKTLILPAFLVLKIILSYALVNPVYELHRDEFLHLDQGSHLAMGYVSVPPLTAIFAWIIKLLGGSFFVVRLFPALFGALTILLAWKIVELLKGDLLARCLVATACMCSVYMRLNILFQPNSFDVLAWTATFYYLLKYFDRPDPVYLYSLAVILALGFLNKYNIVFLLIGLLPALLITPNRKIFSDKHFYYAIVVAFAIALPNLIWQLHHNFPVIKHMKQLQKTQLVHVDRSIFYYNQLLYFISAIFILLAGIGSLLFYKPFKPYRWVIFTYLFTMIVFGYFRAKDYYALGLYPVLLAFGAVYASHVLAKRYVLTAGVFAFIICSFIFLIPYIMPFYSPEQIIARHNKFEKVGLLRWEDGENHQLPQDYADMQGWKEVAHLTDSAYEMVQDKSALIIRGDNYGLTGAANYYSKYKDIKCSIISCGLPVLV